MRVRLALSLQSLLVDRLTAMSRTHRLGAAQVKHWEATLNLLAVKGGEVEVWIGLGAKRPTRELYNVTACIHCNPSKHAQLLLMLCLTARTGNNPISSD